MKDEKEYKSHRQNIDENLLISKYIRFNTRLSVGRNVIVGEDLFLRPLFAEDSKYLYDIYTDKNNMKYFGDGTVFTRQQVDISTARRAAYPENGKMKIYYWLFVTRLGAEGVVAIQYHKNESYAKIGEKNSLEIKTKVRELEDEYDKEVVVARSPKFPGRMIPTKAIKMVMDFIGGDFFATVSPENKKSIATLSERVGFKKREDLGEVAMYSGSRLYYVYSPSAKGKKVCKENFELPECKKPVTSSLGKAISENDKSLTKLVADDTPKDSGISSASTKEKKMSKSLFVK